MPKLLQTAIAAALVLLPVVPACAGSASRSATRAAAPGAGSSAATSGGPRRVTLSDRPTFHFSRCPTSIRAQFAGDGLHCMRVAAPLDYAAPGGRQITLQLAVKLHTAPASDYRGVMLANPGGPGASGIPLALSGEQLPGGVGADYDWVGYDPRGVGASRPAISCQPNYFEGPRSPYGIHAVGAKRYWTRKVRGYAQACGRSSSAPLLRHMSTLDDARDLDTIRRALRLRRISFYGLSWGTYIGEIYATRYPSRVQRLVLDSSINPRQSWFEHDLSQDAGFQHSARAFFAWCAQHDATYHLGDTAAKVQSLYWRELNALQSHPRGVLGGDEFADGMSLVGYSDHLWPETAAAWRSLQAGRPAGFVARYGAADSPGGDNHYAVALATECTDSRWPSLAAQLTAARKQARRNPFYAWRNGWYDAPCAFWPVPARSSPVRVSGRNAPGVLLIDETGDAATPYPGSLVVRRLFPRARLVAVTGGDNHANSLSGNSCVERRIVAYLRSGSLPARRSGRRADVRCAAAPHPAP